MNDEMQVAGIIMPDADGGEIAGVIMPDATGEDELADAELAGLAGGIIKGTINVSNA